MKLRQAVLAGWEVWNISLTLKGCGPLDKLRVMQCLVNYGFSVGRMSGKVTPMRVDALVEKWHKAILGMSTAHTKDDFDAADFQADDLMRPLLTAPIKQVRQFWVKLQRALRDDKAVPWFVWVSFDAWSKTMVKGATEEETLVRLRNKLADEIAALAHPHVKDQLQESISRALRWRDPGTLGEVKKALDSGAKPKMVGRQSCLFMEFDSIRRGPDDQPLMVML